MYWIMWYSSFTGIQEGTQCTKCKNEWALKTSIALLYVLCTLLTIAVAILGYKGKKSLHSLPNIMVVEMIHWQCVEKASIQAIIYNLASLRAAKKQEQCSYDWFTSTVRPPVSVWEKQLFVPLGARWAWYQCSLVMFLCHYLKTIDQ